MLRSYLEFDNIIMWQLMEIGGLGQILDPAQGIVELVSKSGQENVIIQLRNMEEVIALEIPKRKKVGLSFSYLY